MGATQTARGRVAWTDKFSTPTLPTLLGDLEENHRAAVETLRKRLRQIKGVRERLCWMGIPWRWSLAFRVSGRDEAIVYAILDPGGPWASLPMNADEVCAMDVDDLSRVQRDAILEGTKVGDRLWARFCLTSEREVEDLMEMVERKLAVVR